MSIVEKKSLEAYPIKIRHSLDANRQYREGYTKGYDQAMQDFMEKAEEFFNEEFFTRFNGSEYRVSSNKCMNLQQFIELFKNYMQNES